MLVKEILILIIIVPLMRKKMVGPCNQGLIKKVPKFHKLLMMSPASYKIDNPFFINPLQKISSTNVSFNENSSTWLIYDVYSSTLRAGLRYKSANDNI